MQITANEIALYNAFVDEKGTEADRLIAMKVGPEYAEALKAAAEADMADFLSRQ